MNKAASFRHIDDHAHDGEGSLAVAGLSLLTPNISDHFFHPPHHSPICAPQITTSDTLSSSGSFSFFFNPNKTRISSGFCRFVGIENSEGLRQVKTEPEVGDEPGSRIPCTCARGTRFLLVRRDPCITSYDRPFRSAHRETFTA